MTCFLIHTINIWIYVLSRFRLPVGTFRVSKALTLDITRKLSNKFFHSSHAYGKHYGSILFYTVFNDLENGWGSKVQRKAKPVGIIFLIISTDQDEIRCGARVIGVELQNTITVLVRFNA